VTVARALLGKPLQVHRQGELLVARIVECEAYLGQDDPASHAFRGNRGRAAIMYGPPGRLYVYFTYGCHFCINAVTEQDGIAGAVLIRAAEPLKGIPTMQARRGRTALEDLGSGPGKLTQALGIDMDDNGRDLHRGEITIRDAPEIPRDRIGATPRIGIRRAAGTPLRFVVKGSPFLSRPWREDKG